MAASPPSFPFFPSDFLMGTADFSADEVGFYIRLLCFQWANDGIPDKPKMIALIGGLSYQKVRHLWPKLRRKFYYSSMDGRWRNARLEDERVKQFARTTLAIKRGHAGALKRWGGVVQKDDRASIDTPLDAAKMEGSLSVFHVRTSVQQAPPIGTGTSVRRTDLEGKDTRGKRANPPLNGKKHESQSTDLDPVEGADHDQSIDRDRVGGARRGGRVRGVERTDPRASDRERVSDHKPADVSRGDETVRSNGKTEERSAGGVVVATERGLRSPDRAGAAGAPRSDDRTENGSAAPGGDAPGGGRAPSDHDRQRMRQLKARLGDHGARVQPRGGAHGRSRNGNG